MSFVMSHIPLLVMSAGCIFLFCHETERSNWQIVEMSLIKGDSAEPREAIGEFVQNSSIVFIRCH